MDWFRESVYLRSFDSCQRVERSLLPRGSERRVCGARNSNPHAFWVMPGNVPRCRCRCANVVVLRCHMYLTTKVQRTNVGCRSTEFANSGIFYHRISVNTSNKQVPNVLPTPGQPGSQLQLLSSRFRQSLTSTMLVPIRVSQARTDVWITRNCAPVKVERALFLRITALLHWEAIIKGPPGLQSSESTFTTLGDFN